MAQQAGPLKIAEQLAEAPALVRELLEFKAKTSASGHDTYGADAWRENVHDDLLLAFSMSVWFRTWQHAHLDEANAADPRQLYSDQPPPVPRAAAFVAERV